MALITDPDVLSGNSLQIDTATSTVRLCACESLSTDGVTIKCVYSKLKELWRSSSTYIKYPFPMTPITDEQFEMYNGWDWYDNTTRYLLRTGGWAVKDSAGVSEEEWTGVIGLGTLGATDQVYYAQGMASSAGSATHNFQLQGQVNQAICVYQSAAPAYDYRGYLTLYCRTWGKSYGTVSIADIGVTTLTYQAYRFPLSNADDIKVTLATSAMTADPLSSVSITWVAAGTAVTIGGTPYNFHVIIDGAEQNAEDIYQRVQYLSTLASSDIDAGAGLQVGETTPKLLSFVGDTLYTEFFTIAPTGGVYIANFQNDDINRIIFRDDDDADVTYPYTAVLTLNFGDNVQGDVWSKYWVYFTINTSGNYGTADAVLIQDAASVNMTGVASGVSTVQRTFAYDTNVQGGRTAGTVASATAIAIGLSSSQFVKSTCLIEKSTTNTVSLVSALERNYANP